MSNRYWQMAVTDIANLGEVVNQDTLALLAKTDPLIAARLQAVDWTRVTDYVISEAIKEAGKACGFEFVTNASKIHGAAITGIGKACKFTSVTGARRPKGKEMFSGHLIGALVKDNTSLAWVRDKTGVHCIKQALGWDDDRISAVGDVSIREAEGAFDIAYRKQAMKAVATILSDGKVSAEEKDGALVLRLEMEV